MYDQVLTEMNTRLAQELEKCKRQLLATNAELEKYMASPGNIFLYQKFIMIHR